MYKSRHGAAQGSGTPFTNGRTDTSFRKLVKTQMKLQYVAPMSLHMFSFTVVGSPIGTYPNTPGICTQYKYANKQSPTDAHKQLD